MKKELEVTNRVAKGGAKADYKKPSFKRTCKTPVVEKVKYNFGRTKIIRL
jgi:hypothetical protein